MVKQSEIVVKIKLYIVSAWRSADQLVLVQEKVEAKSNEITATPKIPYLFYKLILISPW